MSKETKTQPLEAKLADARARLVTAEDLCQQLVNEIEVSERANKTKISEALESALAKLHAARSDLDSLEAFVFTPEAPPR